MNVFTAAAGLECTRRDVNDQGFAPFGKESTMTNQKNNETASQPVELSEGDLEQVTGGAVAATTALLTPVTVREDPCAGGKITIMKR